MWNICDDDTEPDAIYPSGDEAFLFERTASRLIEMRSEDYLLSRDRRKAAAVSDAKIAQPQPA